MDFADGIFMVLCGVLAMMVVVYFVASYIEMMLKIKKHQNKKSKRSKRRI